MTARVSVPRPPSIVGARDPNGELFREMDLDSAASAVANCADRSAWRARRAWQQAGSWVRGEANRMQALTLANFGMQCDPRPALVQVHPDGWSTSFRGGWACERGVVGPARGKSTPGEFERISMAYAGHFRGAGQPTVPIG